MLSLARPTLLKDKCLINGEWRDAATGQTDDVINPATGEVIASIPFMGAEEAQEAIKHANAAFKSWRMELAKTRSLIILGTFISVTSA